MHPPRAPRFSPHLLPTRLALLTSLALALIPSPPAQPTALVLDGFRDSAYVLIAEDPAGDLAPAAAEQTKFLWADLTRLYIATDADFFYVYVDLPAYTLTHAAGQIGLAVVHPAGAAVGSRTDPISGDHITYAYTSTLQGSCPTVALPQTRHPAVVFRGYILGEQGSPPDLSTGFTMSATSTVGGWQGGASDWGGLTSGLIDDRIAYAPGAGVELMIPWADLALAEPAPMYLSFFTTAAGSTAGNLDALPPDPAASAATTNTVLSQLVNVPLVLPAPASVALGCATTSVAENAGFVALTAQLHTALTQTVAVSYTANALTAGAADFTAHMGTVTFIPNVTRQTILIPITNDSVVEGPETFLVTLTNPQSLSLAAPMTATITILDDDEAAAFELFVPFVRR